jgi:ureidoacrylate peracid hydrolase
MTQPVGLDPRSTAFIVVNPEHAHLDDGYLVEAFSHVARALDSARRLGMMIVFSSLVHAKDGSDLGRYQGPPVRPDEIVAASSKTADTDAVVRSLTPRPGEIVVNRNRYSAFFGTDLDMALRDRWIESVILGGYSTNYCVDSTASDANFRDYRVIVLSDGTTPYPILTGDDGLSVEDTQQFTLATLRLGFAEVLSTDAVVAWLAAGA